MAPCISCLIFSDYIPPEKSRQGYRHVCAYKPVEPRAAHSTQVVLSTIGVAIASTSSVQGQGARGFEHPGLVEGVPAHGRGLEQGDP